MRYYFKIIFSFAFVIISFRVLAQNKNGGISPDLDPVPGYVMKHELPVINPTPQMVATPLTGIMNFSAGINIVEMPEDMKYILSRVKQSEWGIPLYVRISPEKIMNDAVRINGGYNLTVGPDVITITGMDSDGAFYGVQSLLQIIDYLNRQNSIDLPMMEIDDAPDLHNRGVVEGFYGNPWSHETRMAIMDFMGHNKMNMYVFGPKDDPYHRTPYWRQPYPESEANKIKELVECAKKNHINFVWAIHPGGDIRWNKEDRDSLVNKFEMMYDLGVRQFAVFFDDIRGKGTISSKQTELLNDIVKNFINVKPEMRKLIVCPTDYAVNRSDASEKGQLSVYGRELDPNVEVFWTGKVVCGDIEPESIEFVNSRIKRPALVWWNFPVSDYCRHNLLLGPVYGLDNTLTSDQLSGILSNPMEYGEASMSALYGVADYSWNPVSYNPLDNWTRSFSVVMPGAEDAYATFAIHSCDPPRNYRRNESWNIDTFRYNKYTDTQFESLKNEFTAIKNAPDIIFSQGRNLELIKEIAPWLIEFELLGNRGLLALDLIKKYESGNKAEFSKAYKYLENLNYIQKRSYKEHRSGTLKLQPFVNRVLLDLKPYVLN